jgi:ribonuclease HI
MPSTLVSTSSTKRKRGSESKFYAVREGRSPGIYHTWDDCLEQVKGHKGAVCTLQASSSFQLFSLIYFPPDKSFTSLTAAEAFLTSKGPLRASGPAKFYAVRHGHTPGIYSDWPSAQKQITGFQKPKFKSFQTRAEADAFLRAATPDRDAAAVPPPAKKRRSEETPLQQDGVEFNPYLKRLPDDAEDNFDYTMKLDAETGQVRLKTKAELDALKIAPMPTSKEGEVIKVWTDGACRANGKANAAAGLGVWFGSHDPRFVLLALLMRRNWLANTITETSTNASPAPDKQTNAPNFSPSSVHWISCPCMRMPSCIRTPTTRSSA